LRAVQRSKYSGATAGFPHNQETTTRLASCLLVGENSSHWIIIDTSRRGAKYCY